MNHRIAAVQMASGPDVKSNLLEAERLIMEAARLGAKLVVLPENFALMGAVDSDKLSVCEQEGVGPIQGFLVKQAIKYGIWLVGGTIPLASKQQDKVFSSCLVFNDKGKQVARYDKIHLFDVQIKDSSEHYQESSTTCPGQRVVVIDTPFAKLGLAICYDLRFPELFRELLNQQVECIALPSAFTAITGHAHWETLVRARAIENLSYIVAADQGGFHLGGRETYGHSLIVEPWGGIIGHLPKGAGVVVADLDLARLHSIRNHFPVANHRRIGIAPAQPAVA